MVLRRSPPCLLLTGLACALVVPVGACDDGAERGSSGYAVVHGWPALEEGMVLGQVSGVALDGAERVWVFHRASRPWFGGLVVGLVPEPTLLVLDRRDGTILERLGANQFRIPHGLSIDAAGHLWVTDVGRHTVSELAPDGALLRTLGVPDAPGDDEAHFDRPTDVVVAPDGGIYVADGYGNARIVQLDPDGTFVRAWGTRGAAPGELDTPHALAMDAAGRLYVADRGNARIQRFTGEGALVDVWQGEDLGRPWSVTVAADGAVWVVDGGDQHDAPPDRARVVRLDQDGHVLERFARFGNKDGELYWGHDLAVSRAGEVFVGDVYYGMRVQKFTPGGR